MSDIKIVVPEGCSLPPWRACSCGKCGQVWSTEEDSAILQFWDNGLYDETGCKSTKEAKFKNAVFAQALPELYTVAKELAEWSDVDSLGPFITDKRFGEILLLAKSALEKAVTPPDHVKHSMIPF